MTSKKADLADTIERLRQERYVDLPPELVSAILVIESECLENRVEAMRRIAVAIESHLEGGGSAQD